MSKAKAMFPSDTISFKDVDTGHNSAGNGGDGINKGDISSKPTFIYDPTNKADGGNTTVKTGDQVNQKADWDAGGANAHQSLTHTHFRFRHHDRLQDVRFAV